jgi:hypothetical protein
MYKQPIFSMETGNYTSGRPDKHESIRKTVAIGAAVQKSASVRSVQLWSVNQRTEETGEVTGSWIRTKSVTVEEKTLVVQEGMERALGSHRFAML